MARRKTVAVLLAAAPSENTFLDAKIVQKRWTRKTTAEQTKELAEEFHEFLINNAEGGFYDALHRLMSEYAGD